MARAFNYAIQDECGGNLGVRMSAYVSGTLVIRNRYGGLSRIITIVCASDVGRLRKDIADSENPRIISNGRAQCADGWSEISYKTIEVDKVVEGSRS
jgi:hypothetical protein